MQGNFNYTFGHEGRVSEVRPMAADSFSAASYLINAQGQANQSKRFHRIKKTLKGNRF
jgi:hypothetical protein